MLNCDYCTERASVGGDCDVPLGIISLTGHLMMAAMDVWMLVKSMCAAIIRSGSAHLIAFHGLVDTRSCTGHRRMTAFVKSKESTTQKVMTWQ